MTGPVSLEVKEGVARLVLDRPDSGNALDVAMKDALAAAVERVARDHTVRAVLLAAAGRSFCVGGDIGAMRGSGPRLPEWIDGMAGALGDVVLALARLPVPVVSAVQGPVAGGGIGLALCADAVLAGEAMRLRGGYTGIGLTPDLGASWFLARRAGPARAKEVLFQNRALTAAECLSWGLVDAVHPDTLLAAEADALARRLAAGATLAVGRAKALVDGAADRTLEEHLVREREAMVASAGTEDAREGLAAFLEKRPPRFGGR
jgi:2-(1,2-epoxy-1,2-dihydrophenyl)acetyl-CoA isomerase